MTGRRQNQSSAPNHDNQRCDPLNREPLRQENDRVSPQDESKIEYGRRHGEAIPSVQAQVFLDSKQSLQMSVSVSVSTWLAGVGQSYSLSEKDFVRVEKRICHAEDRQ